MDLRMQGRMPKGQRLRAIPELLLRGLQKLSGSEMEQYPAGERIFVKAVMKAVE